MRHKISLDTKWKFHLGEAETDKRITHESAYYSAKAGRQYNPASREWEDAEWPTVDLPHDYVVGSPFSSDEDLSHGYLTKNDAWYRKVFLLPKEWEGKHVLISFEGISVFSQIYFNGSLLARHQNGYLGVEIDVTERAYFGDVPNTLAVFVDGKTSNGWWYEGAGIYRHVNLYVKETLHIAHDGVSVLPRHIEGTKDDFATDITVTVENSDYVSPLSGTLAVRLLREGRPVGEATVPVTASAASTADVSLSIPVREVDRWDVDAPNLYVAEITLLDAEGKEIDAVSTNYGYRTFAVDPETGFSLNGRQLKLRGVCNHQDHAGVGVAVPDGIQDMRVALLKEMGANAYRSAHNPPAPEILDACDRYGVIVMDEHRRFESSREELGYLSALIRRDRNHPSVIFWSLFNEEPLQNTPEGALIFRRQRAEVEKLDKTRLILGAMNGNASGAGQHMDAAGINYGLRILDAEHEKYPWLPIVGSENCSTLATRGCVETSPRGRNKDRTAIAEPGDPQVMSDYDEEFPSWGSPVRTAWRAVLDRPWYSGIFIWTGFDYRGEPTPFNWPSVSSQFGLMDTCGHPKAAYYYTKACYTDAPMIHITPHWSFSEGETVRVVPISNCDEVELFLNGESLGRRANNVTEQNEWQLTFTPGVLSAVGYRDGVAVATDERRTAGKAVAVKLLPYGTSLVGSGHDATSVSVALVDAEGNILPTATDHVRFAIEGGRILGTGNGYPNSHENDTLPERDLFAGLAAAIIKADASETDTVLTLTASVDGLPDAILTLPVKGCPRELTVATCDSRFLDGITASDIFGEKPDYVRPIADNDMNTLSPITLGTPDFDFTKGWRFYRARVKVPAGKTETAQVSLEVTPFAEEFFVAVNGKEVFRAEKVYQKTRVSFEAKPGEALDIRFLTKAWGEKPSGLCSQIRLVLA